ncbi:MAG: HlyD family efflux transporter periplasmic adaptor subunit [Alphaproteobacteria bacterium]|nr:MAG: HlyD family efflux transporter periplasmic adaptor subunit [Alphaproteobacteria bacterium]
MFVERLTRLFARYILTIAALLLSQGCSEHPAGDYSGFVEGQFVRPGPVAGGTLKQLHVREGDTVNKGDWLFALDDTAEKAALGAAEATLAEARSRLENLRYGRRAEEIAVIEAKYARAEAQLKLAKLNYQRAENLVAGDVISQERRDHAEAEYAAAHAEVAAIAAELKVARLPARKEEIDAAEAALAAAEAAVEEARWRLDERKVAAPEAGRIEDRYFLPGDFVPPGAPVVALLPPGNLKLVFFVPEPNIAGLRIGQAVRATCDGCPAPIRANISFISSVAEFTPPVIYSEKTRSKLMFRVEARPVENPDVLHPGQPVDVTLE